MADNLLSTPEEEINKEINILDKEPLAEKLEGFKSNLIKIVEIEKEGIMEKTIKELDDLADYFQKIEAKAYKSICGEECTSYKIFQDKIARFFVDNELFFNDIQKIAVRRSVQEEGMRTLQKMQATVSKNGTTKVVLSAEEIRAELSKIIPIDANSSINTDVIFSENFLSEHSDWLNLLEEKTSIAKKKGKIKEGESPFYVEANEAMKNALSKISLQETINEEDLKKNFWPIYRNYFLIQFCNYLEEEIDKVKDTISATQETVNKEKKVVLHGGLYPAIIKAKDAAIEATDNFFYEGQGTIFSMELEGKMVTISPVKGLFKKMTVNFSNKMMERIRSTLEKRIKQEMQNIQKIQGNVVNFSDAETTYQWIIGTFEFESLDTKKIIWRILKNTKKDYFNSTNPAQIIGDLSEVLYIQFFNMLSHNRKFATALGGSRKELTKEEKKNLSSAELAWKNNKQPAVDLLLNGKYGIQVKNAFSTKALTSHSINFVTKKNLETLFLTEFRNVPNKESLKALTANVIYLDAQGQERDRNIWDLLADIYTFYLDVVLDLGKYDPDVFAGDKNVFYLYLSQYLIPASELIRSAKESLINVSGHKKIIKLSSELDGNKRDKTNLYTRAKLGIDFTFYNDFIEGFDILKSALELQKQEKKI